MRNNNNINFFHAEMQNVFIFPYFYTNENFSVVTEFTQWNFSALFLAVLYLLWGDVGALFLANADLMSNWLKNFVSLCYVSSNFLPLISIKKGCITVSYKKKFLIICPSQKQSKHMETKQTQATEKAQVFNTSGNKLLVRFT